MRFFTSLVLALALGAMGCGETAGTGGSGGDGGAAGDGGSGGTAGTGGNGVCADWAGDWTTTNISCDDVAANTPDIEFRVAGDCSGEAIIGTSDTCTVTNQLTVTRETGDTTTLDTGTVTCSAECTADECQPLADGAMPYSATLIVTDDTWTLTALTTQQMVADDVTPCEVGETMVTVAVPK